MLAPDASGECRLEVEEFRRAAARVAGRRPESVDTAGLEEVPGLCVLMTWAGETFPDEFPLNPLGAVVAMAMGAPQRKGWRGPVAFYRAGVHGHPAPLSVKDAVLVTSLTIRSVHELTGRTI